MNEKRSSRAHLDHSLEVGSELVGVVGGVAILRGHQREAEVLVVGLCGQIRRSHAVHALIVVAHLLLNAI